MLLTFAIHYVIRPANGGQWINGRLLVDARTRAEALWRTADRIPAGRGDHVRKWVEVAY